MTIQELLKRYAQSAQVSALTKTLDNHSVKTVFLDGLMGSSAPMLFAALRGHAMLFILQDADEPSDDEFSQPQRGQTPL